MEPISASNNSSTQCDENSCVSNPSLPIVKDKGEVIMDTMNLVIKSKKFDTQMKTLFEGMRDFVARGTLEKQALDEYVSNFYGNDANLTRLFIIDDLKRDLLHAVKMKNALAVIEDSLDLKTEIIDRFSKV